jgi:hypothetical protein
MKKIRLEIKSRKKKKNLSSYNFYYCLITTGKLYCGSCINSLHNLVWSTELVKNNSEFEGGFLS